MKKTLIILVMVFMVVGFVVAEESATDYSVLWGEKGRNWYSPEGEDMYIFSFIPPKEDGNGGFILQIKKSDSSLTATAEFSIMMDERFVLAYDTVYMEVGGQYVKREEKRITIMEIVVSEDQSYIVADGRKFMSEEFMETLLGIEG